MGLLNSSLTTPLMRPCCACAAAEAAYPAQAIDSIAVMAARDRRERSRMVRTSGKALRARSENQYISEYLHPSQQPCGLIQQHVHEHAGHRHVEPDGKCPAGNG